MGSHPLAPNSQTPVGWSQDGPLGGDMKRRSRRRYRAIRRVPQAYSGLYLRLKVAPIVPALAATVAVGSLAEIPALPGQLRTRARRASDDMGTAISEKSQRIFFDTPGLDFLSGPSRTWRAAPRASGACGRTRSSHSAPIGMGAWLA